MGDGWRQILASDTLELGFDGLTGLISVRNKGAGNEYLNGPETEGNPFRVYHDFDREFEISAPKGRTPNKADLPGDISRMAFSPVGGKARFSRRQEAGRDVFRRKCRPADTLYGWNPMSS